MNLRVFAVLIATVMSAASLPGAEFFRARSRTALSASRNQNVNNASDSTAGGINSAEAKAALKKAVEFFQSQVSVNGGFLWRYSHDLSRREGEGRASESTAWVQPPGTPTVGNALLDAYEVTGIEFLRNAARRSAGALIQGQLVSGGWDYRIEFSPDRRNRYAYRVDGSRRGRRNVTTLDDNTTQSALRFLIRMDQVLEFQDRPLHEASRYALSSLLKVQYPNGAWPQRYSAFPDPEEFPVKKASYPESWPREWPKKDYRSYYTFNDNSIADVIETLFEAADVYDEPSYRAAAEKAGDFILLAQMPEPQPAWAQQYNRDMHPAWARRFEPPSITGGESQGILRTLMMLSRATGKQKYLEPIPRAVQYLKQSQIGDRRLARFYELKTNRPLYFTKEYELTYRDDDLPTHYGFQVGSKLESIEAQYERLLDRGPRPADQPFRTRPSPPQRLSRSLAARAAQLVERLDDRGAWVEEGQLRYHGPDDDTTRIISTTTFVRNIRTLAQFLAAANLR